MRDTEVGIHCYVNKVGVMIVYETLKIPNLTILNTK